MKAVILAGGGGTRLWPLSTPEKPKQFQKLVSDKTMFEEALDLIDFLNPKDIFIALNEKHTNLVQTLAPKIPQENYIIEPALRDTASCLGYAAAFIEQKHPGEVVTIIYADQIIKNKDEFQEKLKVAEEVAKSQNTLNIIEIPAASPNPNYGYVKLKGLDQKIDSTEVYHLDSFVEKPDVETAKKFIEEGNYLWNTGLYVWKTSSLLEAFAAHQPQSYQIFQEIIQDPQKLHDLYPTLEKISIDYAIMEKVDPEKVRIIKADLQIIDAGNWESIYNELAKSPGENITRGPVDLLDCEGCLIYADNNTPIKAIGLKNQVIIDSPAGNLSCPLNQSKRIKELLN